MNQATLLSGKIILITRPAGRESHLRHLIQQAGGSVIHYPVFEIQAPADSAVKELTLLRDQLHKFTMAIFISPTAVEQSQIYFPALPEHLSIVSIGSKTTQALALQNIRVDIEAPRHNTESLLQSSHLRPSNIQGQQILIFRGNGGRALLGDTLVHRGATVRYVETYERKTPSLPPLTGQQIASLDAITISSNEGLNNLITLIKDTRLLHHIPLIVPGKRSATLAKQYGFNIIVTASSATDEATLSALSDHLSVPDQIP